jgi:hypothetical protein
LAAGAWCSTPPRPLALRLDRGRLTTLVDRAHRVEDRWFLPARQRAGRGAASAPADVRDCASNRLQASVGWADRYDATFRAATAAPIGFANGVYPAPGSTRSTCSRADESDNTRPSPCASPVGR